MAWCLIDDKPLSVPMMTFYTDAYMLHSASTECITVISLANQYRHKAIPVVCTVDPYQIVWQQATLMQCIYA